MPREDDPRHGPAMLALPNDRWRMAVEAYVMNPGPSSQNKGHVAAIRAAGFQGTDGSLRVTAHRMFNDARMQLAITEVLRKVVRVDGVRAREVMVGIMEDRAHPMQFAAAAKIVDKAIPQQVEVQHQHEHIVAPEMMTRAIQIARALGKPIEELVGYKLAKQIGHAPEEPLPTVVDVEYAEVVGVHRVPEGGW